MGEAAPVEVKEEVEVEETPEPTLRVWDLTQVDELALFAKLIGETPELWDDEALRNPAATFTQLYLNQASLIFEVGKRAGMIAVVRVVPGFRGFVMGAAWKPEAMRVPELGRRALRAAMISRDLLYIESLVVESNELSRKATEAMGFENRGTLRRSSYYNGAPKTMMWYVLTREALGVED